MKLTEKEKNQYLWHGVKYKDPKIIYEGEGFKTNFCRKENENEDNLWCGRGIYFTENFMVANYYAYKFKKEGEFKE